MHCYGKAIVNNENTKIAEISLCCSTKTVINEIELISRFIQFCQCLCCNTNCSIGVSYLLIKTSVKHIQTCPPIHPPTRTHTYTHTHTHKHTHTQTHTHTHTHTHMHTNTQTLWALRIQCNGINNFL